MFQRRCHALLKLERRGDAYAQFSLAETLARDAGDDTLLAVVLAIRSGLYSRTSMGRRPGDPDRAIALLDAAAAAAANAPGRVRVLVFARRAEESAAVQDGVRTLRDLEVAEESLDLPDDQALFGPRDGAELGALRGWCEALLGRNREAVCTLQQTAERMHPSLVAWRSAVLADQGAALARLGQIDEACASLSRALELARQATANDHLRRIAGVRHMHLARFGNDPAVRRLDDELGSMAPGGAEKHWPIATNPDRDPIDEEIERVLAANPACWRSSRSTTGVRVEDLDLSRGADRRIGRAALLAA